MRLTSSSTDILVLICIRMASGSIKKLLMILSWISKLGLWCCLMNILGLIIVHHMLEGIDIKMILICPCTIVFLHCVHHSIVLGIWLSSHWIIFHTTIILVQGWVVEKTLLRTKEIHLLNGIDVLLIMLMLVLVHSIHI